MPEETAKIRRYATHVHCDHENTKGDRHECRMAARHAECDHGPSGHERAWCTRRHNAEAQL